MKIRKVYIEDYKIFKDFEIDFTYGGEPLNIIVIAGINGSGKSSLLEYIFKLFVSNDITYKVNNKIICETFDQISGKYIQSTVMSQLSPNEMDKNKVFENTVEYSAYSPIVYYKTYEADIISASQAITKYIDKLIFEKDKKSSEVYSIVKKKLKDIFDGFDLQVEFNLLDKNKDVYFRNDQSKQIPINDLSGGEKELITKAFTFYISDIRDKIILIDEPESSLHPNWQNRILKIYEDFAKENNNQIIIATHSPHIIASAKKESLRLLVKKDEKIEVVSDFDGSYGYEVQRVLLDIMNLESLRIPGVNEKIETLYELVHNNQYNSERFKKLQAEMEELLGRNDKDLMLLRLEIAKRNKMNEKNK